MRRYILIFAVLACGRDEETKYWISSNSLPYKVAYFGNYKISDTLSVPLHLKSSCIAFTPTNNFDSYQDLGNLPFNAAGCSAIKLINRIYIFDPSNNTFIQKASLKYPGDGLCAVILNNQVYAIGGGNNKLDISLRYHACDVLEGKIYVFGGESSNGISSKVLSYDPNSDSWTYITDMKTPRKGVEASRIGNSINNKITNVVEVFRISPIAF
ncbi:MAG: kelch repeat-containing protein [candidate division WOR-3 bacterium]